MGTFLQLGHESWNLAENPEAGPFNGIVLSPVNDSQVEAATRIERLESRDDLEIILDPQLYYPRSRRGSLAQWSYWSSDFETADHGNIGWWGQRAQDVANSCREINGDSFCTPAFSTRAYSDDYYRFIVDIGDSVLPFARDIGVGALLTCIVKLADLEDATRALQIASVVSRTRCDRIYLTFLCGEDANREPLRNSSQLASAIHLIRLLARDLRVHVAFASHDLVLWKFAGAADVSTGKWLNVRRFSPGRWVDEDANGRQVPYWSEDTLLTLLRDQDVLRLDRAGWFAERDFSNNPAAARILEILRNGSGDAWQRLSWLQYLRWARNTEASCATPALAEAVVEATDEAWGIVQDARIAMTDRFNDGSHARAWLNAVREGGSR